MFDPTDSTGGSRPVRTRSTARLLNSAFDATGLGRFAREETGSVTLLSLFFFLMILFVCGMAVDLMRFETRRAALQNTLDSATLAATSIRSDADAEALVRDFMDKRGYDGSRTAVRVVEARSGADPVTGDPGFLAARSVTADYDLDVNTIFMPFIGVEELRTAAAGGAQEGITTVEISLVVDISGSMGGTKIANLKTSAKDFVNQVIDTTRTDNPVSISVVPYNHTVVVPDALLDRLNTAGTIAIPPSQQAPFPGALTQYPRTSVNSKCVRFSDSQMMTDDLEENVPPALNPNYLMLRSITTTEELDRMAYYDPDGISGGGGAYGRPGDGWNRRCNPLNPAILPYETDIPTLETYIDALVAGGNTATDVGLKWGTALLDPAFRDVVTDMVNDGELPGTLQGRPFDYEPGTFMKVVVLMTDGSNTTQYDLEADKKRGPSPVWYSEKAANETGPNGEDWSNLHIVDNLGAFGLPIPDGVKDRNKDWYDGYYIRTTNLLGAPRFLRSHAPGDFADGALFANGQLPDDAVQLDYTQVYDRFSEEAVSHWMRDDNLVSALLFNDHETAETGVVGGRHADLRMTGTSDNATYGVCDAAKVRNDILVYTIAFQAGTTAEALMRDCATADGYYFNAQDGAALTRAFASIASSITTLRLTQ